MKAIAKSPQPKVFIANNCEMTAAIKFGIITEQCKGRGICSITTDGPDFRALECNYANALVRMAPNNKLSMSFLKSSMKTCTVEKYFKSSFFVMDEPFQVPQEVLFQIGLSQYHIETGQYEITEFKQYFEVTF